MKKYQSGWQEVEEESKNIIYSTEEYDTGKIWLDGKRIFGKVVNFVTTESQSAIETGITNADTVFEPTGTVAEKPINFSFAGYTISTFIHIENGVVTLQNKSSSVYANLPAFAILEYTKNEEVVSNEN